MEVGKIYNKNLERLRHLNDMESNFANLKSSNKKANNFVSKDNFDDFIGKLNNACYTPAAPKREDEYEIEITSMNSNSK